MAMDELELRREVAERSRAQRELQKSDPRFRGLVSNLPGMVYRCTYDVDWTTLYMSEGADALFGMIAQPLNDHAHSFKKLVHPDDLPRVQGAVHEAVRAHADYVEYRIVGADGAPSKKSAS